MENTNYCQSCNLLKDVEIFGNKIKVKNYICSCDGKNYREKEGKFKLQMSVIPTNECNGTCKFCVARSTKNYGVETLSEKFDVKSFEECLYALKKIDIIRGIGITGGEPFTDIVLLDEIVSMIYEILGKQMEVTITTNGSRIDEIHKLKYLSSLESLHISRHHFEDGINEEIFGCKVPGFEKLREIISQISYRDLFVLNCVLMKNYIGTRELVHRYLDHAIDMGAYKVSFITGMNVNKFMENEQVNYESVISKSDSSMLFTRNFYDYDFCKCQDGIYVSNNGEIIEFYGRCTKSNGPEYCRGMVYSVDNKLRDGFGGKNILWKK